MRETWYILVDGKVVSPADVVTDAKGALFCKGVAVAMRGDVPSTKGVDIDDAKPKNPAPPKFDLDGSKESREVIADKPKRTYKTRAV